MMQKNELNLTNYTLTHFANSGTKPLEIYIFIDPLCPECWALEPIIKKLIIEYGHYFTLKYVVSTDLKSLNGFCKSKFEQLAKSWEKTATRTGMSCDGSLWFESPIHSPHLAFIAIKAAEMQGRRSGTKFLRKLREVLFLEKQNITDLEVLKECAQTVGLDVDEFLRDIHSENAIRAFQCDIRITAEMGVNQIPSLVFFNQNIDDVGLKITGDYPYEIYEQIVQELTNHTAKKSSLPSIEVFMASFKFVATKEIAVVFNLSMEAAEKELKKLQWKNIVQEIPVKHGVFWKYIK